MANDPRPPWSRGEDLTDIPTMTPARDEVVERRQVPSRAPEPPPSGRGLAIVLFLLVVVLVAGAGYQFWLQSKALKQQLAFADGRLAALEAQLASTGDEISQSDAAVRIRLKELDSEVRKLWDNVWKKSKAQLEEHDKSIRNLTERTGVARKLSSANAASLTGLSAEVEELADIVAALQQSDSRSKAQQVQVREQADKLSQLASQTEALSARVSESEEWVDSFNAFRRQVNQYINAEKDLNTSTPVLQ